MTAFLIGACGFLGVVIGVMAREHREWQRRPRTTLTLPVWDGLPTPDMRALPDLDPWDVRLNSEHGR